MSNPYSVPSMIGKWMMLSLRLGVRFLARLGPIAERWDRALTPPEHFNKHQLKRLELEGTNGQSRNTEEHYEIEDGDDQKRLRSSSTHI